MLKCETVDFNLDFSTGEMYAKIYIILAYISSVLQSRLKYTVPHFSIVKWTD